MDVSVQEKIEKIASKVKIKEREKRLALAVELNQLAKIIIAWKQQNEQSNSIH